MRHLGYWFMLACGGLISGFTLLLGVLSIWIGISHMDRTGSWVAILAGSLATALVLYLFWRFSRHIYTRMKRTDSIDL